MAGRSNGRALECVLVDLDTQRDYCDVCGAHVVANVEQLIPALRRVIAWVKRNQAPIVSSLDARRGLDLHTGLQRFHCLDGSAGQKKLTFTLLRGFAQVEEDNTLTIPLDLFRNVQQVIFRKRDDDLLGNPKADCFLTQLATREFILFGNGLECSVKLLALALVAREKKVTVLVDACGYWSQAKSDYALRQMEAKGVNLMTVDELLTRKLSRRRRYRRHPADRAGANANGKASGNGNGRSPALGNSKAGRNGTGVAMRGQNGVVDGRHGGPAGNGSGR